MVYASFPGLTSLCLPFCLSHLACWHLLIYYISNIIKSKTKKQIQNIKNIIVLFIPQKRWKRRDEKYKLSGPFWHTQSVLYFKFKGGFFFCLSIIVLIFLVLKLFLLDWKIILSLFFPLFGLYIKIQLCAFLVDTNIY